MTQAPTNISLLTGPAPPHDLKLWYGPSNAEEAGGSLSDFAQIFDLTAGGEWPSALWQTSVVSLRSKTLYDMEAASPGFISSVVAPFFLQSGIKLSLNTTAPNFSSLEGPNNVAAQLNRDLFVIEALQNAGVAVDYIILQSTLSKEHPQGIYESLDARIDNIVDYMSGVVAGLNGAGDNIKFSLTDASLAKGEAWRQQYFGVDTCEELFAPLFAALANQNLQLDSIRIDQPWNAYSDFNPGGLSSVDEVVDLLAWLESQGVPSGVLLATPTATTEAQAYEQALQITEALVNANAASYNYEVLSWKQIPLSELPDTPDDPSRYPLTRILKDVGNYLYSRAVIAETGTVGTLVGTLAALDPDAGDTLTFSLVDNPGNLFAIEGTSLLVNGVLDYEQGTSREITVRVTDSTGAFYDEAFTVTLTNVSGVAIAGNGAANVINANTSVAGQPLPTNEEDTINAGNGQDSVAGLGGNDVINGEGGSDTLDGDGGHDRLDGGGGADTLFGGVGNDTLDGGPGGDWMGGGSGDDIYFVDAAGDVVSENFGQGIDSVQASIAYTLPNHIENLTLTGVANSKGTGNALANVIIGNGGANVLAGRGGADTLDGKGGIDTADYAASAAGVSVSLATGVGSGGEAEGDTLFEIENLIGSNKNDTLEGTDGNNVLGGGKGIDTVSYAHASAGVLVNLATTSPQNTIGAGVDTLTSFENAIGSEFNDVLTGTAGGNVIEGLGGADSIAGGGGNDTIDGGAGSDTIVGGVGIDWLTGGEDGDLFVFVTTNESSAAKFDTIDGFEHGLDVIDLSQIDANAGAGGNQAFAFAGESATVVKFSVSWFESGGNTIVRADINGNYGADLLIVLTGTNLQLTASDFLL